MNYRESFLSWREIVGLGRYAPSAAVVEGCRHGKEESSLAVRTIASFPISAFWQNSLET